MKIVKAGSGHMYYWIAPCDMMVVLSRGRPPLDFEAEVTADIHILFCDVCEADL